MLVVFALVGLGAGLAAQSALLTQLGLTETAARTFVLDEIKSPATNRSSAIADRRQSRVSQASLVRSRRRGDGSVRLGEGLRELAGVQGEL